MPNGIRNFFARRLLRQLIELATKTLYSEQFDMDAIVQRLSRKQTSVSLLRAYVAVQTAAQLREALNDTDVDRAFSVFQLSEAYSESPIFPGILDVHKELAEHYWSKAHIAILRGKLAFKKDEYSYAGAIYQFQYSNKGPISKEQRAKYEPLCKKMSDLSGEIEEAELKALKKQDEQEYHRYKEELDARALSDEIDENENEELDSQGVEIVSMLEARLASLLRSSDQKN